MSECGHWWFSSGLPRFFVASVGFMRWVSASVAGFSGKSRFFVLCNLIKPKICPRVHRSRLVDTGLKADSINPGQIELFPVISLRFGCIILYLFSLKPSSFFSFSVCVFPICFGTTRNTTIDFQPIHPKHTWYVRCRNLFHKSHTDNIKGSRIQSRCQGSNPGAKDPIQVPRIQSSMPRI